MKAGSQRRGGRRSKLTPKTQEAICRYLAQGFTFSAACREAGIGPRTGFRWLEKGRRARSGQYWQFWQAVEAAEERVETHLVRSWLVAAEKDWRAAAEFLARRWPERWRPRQVTELTGEGGGAVRIIIEDARGQGQRHSGDDDGSVGLFD